MTRPQSTTYEAGPPAFCPNRECSFHQREIAEKTDWFDHFGSFPTKSRGNIARFRCKSCRKTCSTQTFSIHYWTHSDVDLMALDDRLYACSGYRQIGRDMGLSLPVIVNRAMRISRNYLNLYGAVLESVSIKEDLAFDGFESYTRSQYFPNNFNILVGKESQAVYMMDLTLLRRKGRMTATQKANRKLIDAVWKPARKALVKDCKLIFHELARLVLRRNISTPLVLATDMKKEYVTAIEEDSLMHQLVMHGLVTHCTVDSRAKRTKDLPISAVNYVDREIRKNSAAHVRETVRQDREVNMANERMIITLAHHSFRKPFRIYNRKNIEEAVTHAEVAGFMKSAEARQAFEELYTHRHLWSQQTYQATWVERAWKREMVNPKRVDFKTEETPEKYQAGSVRRAHHFLV